MWVPIALTQQEAVNRNRHYLQVVGRLKPGVPLPQAQTEMTTIARKYEEHERRSAFYTDVVQRVETLAGVRSAAVTTNLPLYRQGNSISVAIEGRPEPPPGQEQIVVTRIVSPRYFDTMSIPLLSGRPLTDQDTNNSPNVVVISETMARRFWPGEDAIGKRIAAGRIRSPEDLIQVIGVVKDVRQFELNADPRPQMYLTYRQAGFFEPRDLVVKTDVDPTSMNFSPGLFQPWESILAVEL